MQTLVEFMNRDRLRKYKVETEYKYFPKDKTELAKIIKRHVKEQGWEADLNGIDVSRIKDMTFLFTILFRLHQFNGDVSQWNVSNVKDMRAMFRFSKFNGNISDWKVDPSCNMTDMFDKCPLEKHPPKWYKG